MKLVELKIYTLEKDIPNSLRLGGSAKLLDAAGYDTISARTMGTRDADKGWDPSGIIAPPEPWLLKEQFRIMLMRRFVGQGRLD